MSGILNKLIKEYGLEGKMTEYMIAERWETIVGKTIAVHSQPTEIRYRKLYVIVDSHVWLQEISFYKEDLINKVNRYFGKNIIDKVYFRI